MKRKIPLFLLFVLCLFCVFAQGRVRVFKYPIVDYPTKPLQAENCYLISNVAVDSVYLGYGSGWMCAKKVRLNNVEEEKCGPFHAVLTSMNWTEMRRELCLKDAGEGRVSCEVRTCESGESFILNKEPLDSCCERRFRVLDTAFLIARYDVVKEVNVARLQLKGRRLRMGSVVGKTDTCGLFTMDVPLNQEVFYGFFFDNRYIYWVRVLITSNGFNPNFPKECDAPECYRYTRVNWRRIHKMHL